MYQDTRSFGDWGGPPVIPPGGYMQQPAQGYFQQSAPVVQPVIQQPAYYGPPYGAGSFGPYASYPQGTHGGTTIMQGPPVLPYGYPAVPPQQIMSQPMVIPRRASPQIVYVPSPRSRSSRSRSYSPSPPIRHRHHRHGRSDRRPRRRGRSPEPEYARYSSRRSRSRSRSFSRSPVRVPSPPTGYHTTPTGGGRTKGVQKQRDEPQTKVPRMMLPEWMLHPDSTSPPYQFNPLLAGESHQQTLITVDMRVSSYTFEPKRLASPGATTGAALHKEELYQPATYPGVTEMSITCDELPQWKMELKSSVDPSPSVFYSVEERREHTPPLTVHDVLLGIQRSIRSSISHEEWDQLSADQQNSIADAYIRRCRANPETKVFEESQGVRRVDYLLDKHFFKGLALPKGPEQFKNVKLIVGKK